MNRYVQIAGMWLVGEDMPCETNRVTLHPSVIDQWGEPRPSTSPTGCVRASSEPPGGLGTDTAEQARGAVWGG